MSDQHKYQVKLSWIADRKGIIQSDALRSEIEVVTPPEFPKGIPGFLVAGTFICGFGK